MARDLEEVYTLLGYRFADPALLEQALTHPSCSGVPNYQRLEFIGDRVLGAIIAQRLYRDYPAFNEGDLAIRFNELVRKETLSRILVRLGLDRFVRLSTGEEDNGGREKPAILADCCEAVIGAMFMDSGFASAHAFVEKHWQDLVAGVALKDKDAKTLLQEWAQGRGMAAPSYREIAREGPAHEPEFTVGVSVGRKHQATGKGPSKRAAEQLAARSLLDKLNGTE
ncbi:ribonuclease III [Emcibacter sp. SYSU 3D8]|uniref:ribonuclease III n=1 Tax=Emcibacter sp. SYSU 3D8 TaxID=3133969 RepID=UPI0031FF30A8